MLSYVIEGNNKLEGTIKASGSKNAALPIIATAILNSEKNVFYNIPNIEDTKITLQILRILGCKVTAKSGKITILSREMHSKTIPKELMHKLRSTVILAGAILGRFGEATFSYPGGCNIGKRPIDLHLSSFEKMGVTIEEKDGYIHCKAKDGLKGAKIKLDFPSVGATENIILASVYCKGMTHIINAAKEPEIRDLARCLNQMGAKVYGAGTSRITICGVKKLHKTDYKIMTDRIETGTLLCAAAITHGRIKVENAQPENLLNVLYKLKEMGCTIFINRDDITLKAPKELKSVEIETTPYPGFPTDMQPILGAVLTQANGTSIIKENIFENRFKYIYDLEKMGAKIQHIEKDNEIIINGRNELKGDIVSSADLRGGAALVLAGLCAKGKTKVENIEYILRGYENLDQKLRKLGANIKIEKVV